MELNELVRDAIASLNNGNYRAASSIAKEIARLGGSMDGNYKEKVLERIQKLEQDALKYDARGDTAQASSIVAEVERWRRSLGVDVTAPTSPVTDQAIKELDPDKYLGTLGLLADAPKNPNKPHYTGFPAADSGGWVWVKSEAKIDGVDLLIDQNWMCTADGTLAGKPEKWELTQKGTKIAQYAAHAQCIGELRRQLDESKVNLVSIPSGQSRSIPFTIPAGSGIFQNRIAADNQLTLYLTDLYDLPLAKVQFDIYVSVQFQFDNTGDRSLSVNLGSYYPENENKYSLNLESSIVDTTNTPASRTGHTNLLLYRPRIVLPLTDPLDDLPITHALYCSVRQDSGASLNIIFTELKVVAWA